MMALNLSADDRAWFDANPDRDFRVRTDKVHPTGLTTDAIVSRRDGTSVSVPAGAYVSSDDCRLEHEHEIRVMVGDYWRRHYAALDEAERSFVAGAALTDFYCGEDRDHGLDHPDRENPEGGEA